MTNSYDPSPAYSGVAHPQPQDLDQMQPPMHGQHDTNRLACAAHLRHSIEFAQHEITYWEGVVKQLTLTAEDMEQK